VNLKSYTYEGQNPHFHIEQNFTPKGLKIVDLLLHEWKKLFLFTSNLIIIFFFWHKWQGIPLQKIKVQGFPTTSGLAKRGQLNIQYNTHSNLDMDPITLKFNLCSQMGWIFFYILIKYFTSVLYSWSLKKSFNFHFQLTYPNPAFFWQWLPGKKMVLHGVK